MKKLVSLLLALVLSMVLASTALAEGPVQLKIATWTSNEAQLELLASDGMLVKRPVLVLENTALFGFREKAWAEALLKQSLPENAEGEENKCR